MTATIVIVGYRADDELMRCLASIARHDPDVPVVVVDHGVAASRQDACAAACPRVTYVARHANPGFAAGVNLGVRHAGPGAILLLNPDCELDGPLVAPLAAVLRAHPDAGVAGGLLLETDGAVQASARRFPDATTALGGRTSWVSRLWPGNPLTRRNLTTDVTAGPTYVDWVSGACMLIRREAFDAVGGFDEGFFLFWEDADFCRRLAAVGWRTLYAPVGSVLHLTGRTRRQAPVRSLAAFHRSALRYYWKHASPAARLAAPAVAIGLGLRFLLRLPSAGRH